MEGKDQKRHNYKKGGGGGEREKEKPEKQVVPYICKETMIWRDNVASGADLNKI